MNNSQEIIAAAAALSKIAEIRQFKLPDDYEYLVNQESIQRVNAAAVAATGIDLLNSRRDLSFDQINIYENYLDDLVAKNLSAKHSDSFLLEELNLLDATSTYSIELFKAVSFKSNYLPKTIKAMLNSVGVITPAIIPIVKDPLKVQKTLSTYDEFFTVSKFIIKSKCIYALFHIGNGPLAESTSIPKISSVFDNPQTSMMTSLDKMHIACCFLFSESVAYNSSPVELFLKGIVKYGRNVSIGTASQKFFHEVTSSKLMLNSNSDDDIKLSNMLFGVNQRVLGNLSAEKTLTGFQYNNLYFLDADRMLLDYANHRF